MYFYIGFAGNLDSRQWVAYADTHKKKINIQCFLWDEVF